MKREIFQSPCVKVPQYSGPYKANISC